MTVTPDEAADIPAVDIDDIPEPDFQAIQDEVQVDETDRG